MTDEHTDLALGRCSCDALRYRLIGPPLFVHCCHCRWCQRHSGAAFSYSALIESDRIQLVRGTPQVQRSRSFSGKALQSAHCNSCRTLLWSRYAGRAEALSFIAVGTLDEPQRFPPDIHIYTASKQPWVAIPAGVPAVPEYYDRRLYWPDASLARRRAMFGTAD